jgi:ABC-type phosphate transport system ATPase subunit
MADVSLSAPPPSHSPMLYEKITVRHLDFYYGETRALKDISLPFYANRVTALIGPTGCGKSTLLRVFNRIYELSIRVTGPKGRCCSTAKTSLRATSI